MVIPTYKRPAFLKRAVNSVKKQIFSDWELIISDDEDPPGETWDYLQELSSAGSRVTVIRNPGPHGQAGNMNNLLNAARGTWIKPLYDDDVLKSDCLLRLYKAVEKQKSVALIRCLSNQYRENTLSKKAKKGKRATLELIPQILVHLAMYLHDVDIGIPTQVMVNRSCIDKAALFEDLPQLVTVHDVWWYCKVLQHGDLLLLNDSLVDQHQGKRESITSNVEEKTLDREFEYLRELIFGLIDPKLFPPPLAPTKKMVRLIRALHRLTNLETADGLRLLLTSLHYKAIFLTARWTLSKSFPGRFSIVPRRIIAK